MAIQAGRSRTSHHGRVRPFSEMGQLKKLKVAVVDMAAKAPTSRLWGRIMNANLTSIMPQVVALWCEQEGHEVTFICYTGRSFDSLVDGLPDAVDLVFIGAFTQAALPAYALSNLLRSRGAVTALGGPHARCYPQDARQYFDYVLGFSNRESIADVLRECEPHRPLGRMMSASRHPDGLPGVRERWKFIEQTHEQAPFLKIVPMIGSLGCPYTCNFCIDSEVPYQPLDFDDLKNDLRFLRQKFKRPRVGWHDPNFGIRFNDYLDAIEEAVPPDSIDFIAESSLSLLSESHVTRLKKNGFKGILPGIESWYDMGNKSKTGSKKGETKVQHVSDHVNMILRHIPFVQGNLLFGLDVDRGDQPFELTKRFLDLTPGVFPAYSLLTSFGQAAPLNIEYQRDGRVLPFPFHFMNNNQVMNVRPKNYSWTEFYDHLIDIQGYSFSWPAIGKRHRAVKSAIPRWIHFVRSVSSEGFGRLRYFKKLRHLLDVDRHVRKYFERETEEIPAFFVDWIRRDLGPLWEWLPNGALHHDQNAYLHSTETVRIEPVHAAGAKL